MNDTNTEEHNPLSIIIYSNDSKLSL